VGNQQRQMESMGVDNFRSVYKDQKVFVTGHTGFKGTWFITWLDLLGASVKGYALAPDDKSLFNDVSSELVFESLIADIRDKKKLQDEILIGKEIV
jgi:CDP-glucose 4,6-dehydratase